MLYSFLLLIFIFDQLGIIPCRPHKSSEEDEAGKAPLTLLAAWARSPKAQSVSVPDRASCRGCRRARPRIELESRVVPSLWCAIERWSNHSCQKASRCPFTRMTYLICWRSGRMTFARLGKRIPSLAVKPSCQKE